LLDWADAAGPNLAALFRHILATKPHPEMGYRSCLGLMRLSGKYTLERLEAAAARALHFGAHSLASIESILQHHLDSQSLPAVVEIPTILVVHDNLRGATYFDSLA
jgi:hypothetical protein